MARLLAILVIAGLVTAPLLTPAAAQRISTAAMNGVTMGDITMGDMAMMSDDMPCCPDQQPSNDCHDCAIVAMCISTFMQANPDMAAAILIRQPTRTLLAAYDDALSEGLNRPPPDQPPRTLV